MAVLDQETIKIRLACSEVTNRSFLLILNIYSKNILSILSRKLTPKSRPPRFLPIIMKKYFLKLEKQFQVYDRHSTL